MICFKDKTFCVAADTVNGVCDNKDCYRYFAKSEKESYDHWCQGFIDNEGPIAYCDFSYDCEYYINKFLDDEEKKI